MQLSEEFVTLMKNFSAINPSIVLRKGNTQRIMAANKTILAEAEFADDIPNDFGIYDLNEFLNVVSLFSDTNLDFSEKYVLVSDGGTSKIKYFAAGEGVVKSAPTTIKFPSSDVSFTLEAGQLAMIQRTSSVLKASDVAIVGADGKLKVIVSDKKNDTSNAYEVTLGDTDETFKANIKVENLKMLPGDYEVSVSSKKISRFKSPSSDLVYYVAVEADSTFEF